MPQRFSRNSAAALVPTPLLGTTLAELALLAADQPDADTLEQLAAGAAIGAVVFDRDYVVNGDIADVVVAVDGARLVRWNDVTAEAATDRRPDPPAGPGHRRLHRADRNRSRPRRHRRHPAGRRTGRRRGALPGTDRRLHQGAGAVRPADRQLPGAQAPDGRPLRRGAVGPGRRRRCDRRSPLPPRRRWPGWPPARPSATVAGEAIQLHGGIAITWEHDIQLYFKRAHGSAQLFGPPQRPTAQARIRSVLAWVR